MKKLSITISCLLAMAALTFGQNLSFNDGVGDPVAGSYNPGNTFSLNVSATWTGFTGRGLSYWLEVPTALAPFITITGEQYFTWSDPNGSNFTTITFVGTSGADAGFNNANRDMGATSAFDDNTLMFTEDRAPGTFQVSTLTFNILAGAPVGTYQLRTTSASPRTSEISDNQNAAHNLTGQAIYTITIVPEPATWSLIGLGGLASLGLTWLRARRS